MRTTFATRSAEAKPSPGWVNRTDPGEETSPRDSDSFKFFIVTRQKTRIAKCVCVFGYEKFYNFQDLNDTEKDKNRKVTNNL